MSSKSLRSFAFTAAILLTGSLQAQLLWTPHPESPLGPPFAVNNLPDVIYDEENDLWRAWFSPNEWQIAYVESDDGIHWDPASYGVVLPAASGESWESCWKWAPCVIYDPEHPSVVVDESTDPPTPYAYQMWYTAGGPCGSDTQQIGYVVSHDGRDWIRPLSGPVLSVGPDAWDSRWIHMGRVLYDADDDLYRVWYAGGEAGPPYNLGLATSRDGMHWTKEPDHLSLRVEGEWSTINCEVIHNGTHYEMWFSVYRGNRWNIDYARSLDGVLWTRAESTFLLPPSGAWDGRGVCNPTVYFDGSDYRLWYTGLDGWDGNTFTGWRTGLATGTAESPRPHFRLTPDNGLVESQTITFDASRSNSPLTPVPELTYHWEFGDGETADGIIVEHSYAAGDYTARLEISDGQRTATIERRLSVGPGPVLFRRGDVNGDDSTNLTDAVSVLGFLFLGGAVPPCMKSADIDDSGALEISDAVYLLNYLFLGERSPEEPFAECGPDPTVDELKCESFEACAIPIDRNDS